MAKKAEFNLATVKKYVFWAFIPVALILPLITTSMAVATITAAFEKRKGDLNNKKASVEKIKSASDHPNQKTIDEINERTKELRGRVRKAWGTLERDQRERNLWPSEVGHDFLQEIQSLKWGEEISLEGREKYMTFAQKYLPALEIFVERRRVQYREREEEDAKWGPWQEMEDTKNVSAMMTAQVGSGGMESGMGGSMEGGMGGVSFGSMDSMGSLEPVLPKHEKLEFRYHGKVDWAMPETRLVVSSWGSLPKYTEIWYAQEELWVYKALLTVIRQSNLDATGPHNATIKKIENLLIGQAASSALEAQSKNRIKFGGAGGGADTMLSGASDSLSGDGSMGGGQMVARTEEDAEKIKKERRYVDEKGTPLKADEKSKFDQFKRMPICLRLIVDQRKIPEILVNCANCSMPIDVLWVRINPGAAKPFELSALDSTATSVSSAAGSEMSSGDGSGYGGSMDGGGMGGTGGGGMGSDDIQVRLDGVGGPYGTNAIPIEIYGCINIFNPVEQSTELATGPEQEGADEQEQPAEIRTEAPLEETIRAEEKEEE